MSRKKRKQAIRQMQASPQQQASATVANANGASAATQTQSVKPPTNWVAWLALVVSLLSAGGTAFNATTSKRNYDRAAGRIRAKLEIVGALPAQEDIPPQLLEVSDIFDAPELTLHEVDDFFRLNPIALLKNAGEEPISEIRLETRLESSFIDMRGDPMERQMRPTPWAFEDATREDYVLGEKLMPGKSVAVSITKGLLKQMVQLQANDRPERWHYAQFEIR
jgi:hypothetical protein